MEDLVTAFRSYFAAPALIEQILAEE